MRRKINFFQTVLIVCISILVYSCSQKSSSWPQFRGPDNNMVAAGTNYPTEWNDSLNVKWSTNLTGAGWSSPIVVGDIIFITSAFLEKAAPVDPKAVQPAPPPPPPVPGVHPVTQQGPPPPQAEDSSYMKEVYRWELTCIDLKSGKELWKQVARNGSPGIKKHVGNTYACETPVSDGKRVYAYFGMTGVYCYDLDGKLLWQKELGSFKTLNGWGTGSSPVVSQGILYIQVDNEEGSFLTALDAATGIEKWKVTRDEKTNYSTPVIWKNKVRSELVTTGKSVRSYDPLTGNLIWQLKIGLEMSIPSPVYDREHIYLGNSGGPGKKGILYSIKAGAEGDITPKDSALVSNGVEWTLRGAGTSNPSPLLYKGLLYLLSGRGGELQCVDASTGKQEYKEKIEKVGACWSSPWAYNDQICFYDEKGVTSQNTLNDKFWASAAITEDAYIFRGVKKLYCVKK
ncbi:MAG: PQQ-binding-like beta-propeller repeat protein [Bacteroidia bacterium]|nr:PQQ-binding-like beta-propeller repeat protein [Bacteroidia bacterium]